MAIRKDVSENSTKPTSELMNIAVHVWRVGQVTEAARRMERHDALVMELSEILFVGLRWGMSKGCVEVLM
jgi:hypothetical protein